jgi:hypothetical protein
MLPDKDTNKISELKSNFVEDHKNQKFFDKIIGLLKLGKYHALFSSVKQKGIPVLQLISILITFPFLGQSNVHKFTNSYWNKFSKHGKDAYYRLKNNSKINWRGFLFAIIIRTLSVFNSRKSDKEATNQSVKAFIFDDTSIEKFGKFIEGVSRIWNHVVHRHVLGFQLLVMGLYNGTMFLPINFSLHREKGNNQNKPYGLKSKDLKKQYNKKRDPKTNGAKRKKELDKSKIKLVVEMIISAVKNNIIADYVLTDSWFTCFETVKTTLENGMHYIGMFSKVKTKFEYKNQKMTYKEIQRSNRKNIKRSKRFNLYYICTVVNWNGYDIVLYASKKGKNGKWKSIISSDLSLNFNQTIEIYQIRWSIEVFFKESKQLLNLGKSQSQDFDAQIADISLAMIQYIFLILQNSIEKYESLGKLFEQTKENNLELRLHERLVALLVAVIDIIAELFEEADYNDVFEKIIYDEKAQNKLLLLCNFDQKQYKLSA